MVSERRTRIGSYACGACVQPSLDTITRCITTPYRSWIFLDSSFILRQDPDPVSPTGSPPPIQAATSRATSADAPAAPPGSAYSITPPMMRMQTDADGAGGGVGPAGDALRVMVNTPLSPIPSHAHPHPLSQHQRTPAATSASSIVAAPFWKEDIYYALKERNRLHRDQFKTVFDACMYATVDALSIRSVFNIPI